jgi:hypothetical protein
LQKLLTVAAIAAVLLAAASLILGRWPEGQTAASSESSQNAASESLPLAETVPVHFWISNQSLGTGIAALQMTVALDGTVIFDELMAVETQHNVAQVDVDLEPGPHNIDVTVGAPHNLLTSEAVEIDGEVWIFIRFWFDPVSVHENQQTPIITIDTFDQAPGIS